MSDSRQQRQLHHLRVVLFASGQGGDASSYRPNRDNQWWNRRDALVRCVASFLFGPVTTQKVSSNLVTVNDRVDKELVILFDGDLSRLHMTYKLPSDPPLSDDVVLIPTERNILEVWKRCCKEPGVPISNKGFRSQLIKANASPDSQGVRTGVKSPVRVSVGGNSSKRDILEFLQAHTSVEFLRLHRLNASASVILRKANKESLLHVYQEWMNGQKSGGAGGSISKHHADSKRKNLPDLSLILHELLKPSNGCQETLAAMLHESSDELPLIDDSCTSMSVRRQLCLFLGAVRDMTKREISSLQAACRDENTALCRVRLGPVAEFTSKILTVVAFHHAAGKLHRGLQTFNQQHTRVRTTLNSVAKRKRDDSVRSRKLTSNYVCLVPFASSCVTLDMGSRTQLWELIRITVVSLWRSKMASKSGASDEDAPRDSGLFRNRLFLVFADAVHVALDDTTVKDMAEKHQAAPSESQVLEVILKQMEEARQPANFLSHKDTLRKVCQSIIADVSPREQILFLECAIDEGVELAASFYTDDARQTKGRSTSELTLIALLSVQEKRSCLHRKELLGVLNAQGVQVAQARFHLPCPDRCAATITLLQHFCYHNSAFIHESVGLKSKNEHSNRASRK